MLQDFDPSIRKATLIMVFRAATLEARLNTSINSSKVNGKAQTKAAQASLRSNQNRTLERGANPLQIQG